MSADELLQIGFPDEIVDVLVAIVQRAYHENSEIHSPEIGHDETSFGFLLYKSIRLFLCESANLSDVIKVKQSYPQFVVEVCGFPLSAYRAGGASDLYPEDAFPKNRNGARILTVANLMQKTFFELPGFIPPELGWSLGSRPSVILAHSGSFETGLSQIFLGIPAKLDDSGRISSWEGTRSLWVRGKESMAMAANSISSMNDSDIVHVDPPTIFVNAQKKRSSEND